MKHVLYRHWDDGKQWIRIQDTITGEEWDEPITGWSEIWDLTNGALSYSHTNGTELLQKV
jgi:hypothetical protein